LATPPTRGLRYDPEQVQLLDRATLVRAVTGNDIVYANLAGDLERQAEAIVCVMAQTGVRRLIFVSSMGIYDEIPGERVVERRVSVRVHFTRAWSGDVASVPVTP
jgi:hypothetical protein